MSYNNKDNKSARVKAIKEGEVLDGEEAELLFGNPDEEIQLGPAHKQEVRDEEGRRRFHGAFTGGFSAGYYNSVGSKEGWAPSEFKSTKSNRKMKNAPRERKILDFMDDEDLDSYKPIQNEERNLKVRIESKYSSSKAKDDEVIERYGPDGALISKKPTIAIQYEDSKSGTEDRKPSQSIFSHHHSSNRTVDELNIRGGFGNGVLDDDDDDIDVYAQPSMSTYSIKSSKSKDLGKDEEDGDRIVLGRKKRPPPPQITHYSPPKITAPPTFQPPSSNQSSSTIAFVPKSKRVQPLPQPKAKIIEPTPSVDSNKSNILTEEVMSRFEISVPEAKSALKGFQPFTETPEKQERYKSYLRINAKLEDEPMKFPSNYNLEQISRELEEFFKSARVFKPMNLIISEKFVSGSNHPSTATADETPQAPEHLNMFGALTRTTETFFPERLLCKRFGVDMPDLSQSYRKDRVQELLSTSDVDRMLKRTRHTPQLVHYDPKYADKKTKIDSADSMRRNRRKFESAPTESSSATDTAKPSQASPTNLFNSIFDSDEE